jgi:hypothetical protein
MVSHESLSILTPNKQDANVVLTVYFSDRDPAGPYRLQVPAERTLHQRTNQLEDPETVPPGQDYSLLVQSDVPVIVQHTRLDSRQSENALCSTIAYAVSD